MTEHLVWGVVDITYVFLGGLGAGAFFISALMVLRNKGGAAYFSAARYGAYIALIAAVLGAVILPTELGHPFRAWRVYLNFVHGWESPMFYGAWLLALFIVTSFFYALTFLPKDAAADDRRQSARRKLAYIGLVIGFALAVYYGVLHAAPRARPFWNTPLLPLLFLFSAYATGVGGVVLLRGLLHRKSEDPEAESQYQASGYQLLAWVLTLAVGQLVLLFLFILFGLGFSGVSVQHAISVIMPGGALATSFWAWVVVVGLVIPAVIALVYMAPRLFGNGASIAVPRAAEIILPIALLFGGYMLRYVVVVAGQITGPVGI